MYPHFMHRDSQSVRCVVKHTYPRYSLICCAHRQLYYLCCSYRRTAPVVNIWQVVFFGIYFKSHPSLTIPRQPQELLTVMCKSTEVLIFARAKIAFQTNATVCRILCASRVYVLRRVISLKLRIYTWAV